jgi:FKBP-type peptidyl-prolyl cis-trans isomerase FkpA
MVLRPYFFAFIFGGCLLLSACGSDELQPKPEKHYTKEQLMDANKVDTRRESDEIEACIKHHGWEMEGSGSGLRYMFISRSDKGDSAHTGQFAKVAYQVFLLNGTECYSSDKDGLKEFRIGQDHVESGIHEMILRMKTGDKVRFVLASNRAHGLLGDGDKIPPRAPVLYIMQLISLK